MNDLELAVRAAASAGLDIVFDPESGKAFDELSNEWDPRQDDGDALRLAVALGFSIVQQHSFKGPEPTAVAAGYGLSDFSLTTTQYDSDKFAATRTTVFRAAVEVGKTLPEPEPIFGDFEETPPLKTLIDKQCPECNDKGVRDGNACGTCWDWIPF